MTPDTNTEVSDERLAEMLAGLEGVTRGPYITSRRENRPRDGASYEIGAPDRGVAGMMYAKDAAHFKRCDPDTIRSLVTEIQSRRSANSGLGGASKALQDEIGDPDEWKDARAELASWTGSAFLAGEKVSNEAEAKGELCSFLCKLLGYLHCGEDAARMIHASSLHPADGEPVAWSLGEALKIAEGYIGEYEFDDGERIFHSPTETERLVMIDMINGLFSEQNFINALTPPASPVSAEVKVSDAMVTAALNAWWDGKWPDASDYEMDDMRKDMRAAILASINEVR